MRCAWTVVPSGLSAGDVSLNALWARRQATKFNGVAYIIQRAAEAALSDEDARSARRRYEFKGKRAHSVAPLDEGNLLHGRQIVAYIWMSAPGGMGWEFFDLLLEKSAG